tara:strand:- start:4034 stop:4792 length:759 start_codon:yes stop_codon:yes gene_type:complete
MLQSQIINLDNITLNYNAFNNKSILITGCTDGIGKAVALECAKHNANLILLGKNARKLDKLKTEIQELYNNTPDLLLFDLEKAGFEHYEELANTLSQKHQKLDILLHNAAILGVKTDINNYPILDWFKTMQVNLNSPFILTQTLLPLLKKSNQAELIFTTAPEGFNSQAYYGAYAISKAGINNLAEILSLELESNTNINVNTINPNKVLTKLRNKSFPGEDKRNLLLPENIVGYYLYLMSNPDRLNGVCLDI